MRDLKVSILSLATAALFLGTTATGQALDSRAFQPRDDAGFASIKRSFNATALSFLANFSCNSAGDNEACALTAAIFHKGKFWVLGR